MKQTMKHRNSHIMRSLVRAFTLLALLPIAASAQQPSPKPAPTEASAQAPKRAGEGITIHGHWTIEVRNHDGSLDKRVEFENSLSSPAQGDEVLAQLLSGKIVFGDWAIQVNTVGSICGGNNAQLCELVISTNGIIGSNDCPLNICTYGVKFGNITASGATPASLQLTGSLPVTTAGTISYVRTKFGGCQNSVGTVQSNASPNTCQYAPVTTALPQGTVLNIYNFTATTLATPVSVVAGQTASITVNISFS